MVRSTRNRLLIVAAVLGLAAVSVTQAHACWGWGCYRTCCTPCYSSCWYGACYTSCYPCCTTYWPCGWSYTTSCWPGYDYGYYACCEATCDESVEVQKPDSEPTPAPPEDEAMPAPPVPPETETPQSPPRPQPDKDAAPAPEPSPETSPSKTSPPEPLPAEASPGDAEPAPGPPAPGAMKPPETFPDVRGLPAEPEGPAAPDMPPTPKRKPAPAQPQASAVPADRSASGVIAVWVPADARVVINGLETTSVGPYREYVSYGLRPGAAYKYEIRAQIAREGRLVQKTRTVYLSAGSHQRIAFHFQAKPEEAIVAAW